MNLFELMKEYPGQKYKKEGWARGCYVYYRSGNFFDETAAESNDIVEQTCLSDNWELFSKQKLNITEEDVGKRVRLTSGYVGLITGYGTDPRFPVKVENLWYTIDGQVEGTGFDIEEILD